MKSSVLIFWFSGSGNSLFIAKKTMTNLTKLGYTCKILPIKEKTELPDLENSAIGIVVPVAMQGTYPIVWNFIKRLPHVRFSEVFLIDTLAAYSGGIKGPLKNILAKKGYLTLGAIELIMPGSFLKKREPPNKQKKLETSLRKLNNFCQDLNCNKSHWRDIPVYSWFMSLFFRKKSQAKFWHKFAKKTINKNCINCGICATICPSECTNYAFAHIDIESKNCILCQRCLEFCPENAIELNGRQYIKNGLVSLQEIKEALKMC